jgi:predicted CXXCH cytochrome family protein
MTSSFIILAALLTAFSPSAKDAAHEGLLTVRCLDCHDHLPLGGTRPTLRDEAGDVCISCHQRYHGADEIRSHPVTGVPSLRVPPDMVLDSKGGMTCITCHNFHGEYRDENGKKRFYLRRSPGRTFCYSCHKKL